MELARAKQADLAGSSGAGILGTGLGVLLTEFVPPELAQPLAFALVVIGIVLHGWGMLEKRRLEAGVSIPQWSKALYWLCWAALAVLLAWMGVTALQK
jgi:hypothetical protein